MDLLRDHRHEGWVLAAYPDPHTSRPLIGAGFSLDVPAREHPQRDPLNPHPFLEPSSAQLWQAAGLDPDRLERILAQYDRELENRIQTRSRRKHRRRTRTPALTPQVTDEEATRLLRISAIQAVYNARGYCRDFDRLRAAQQLALSQLVFQMGVNLEEFVQFLAALNGDPLPVSSAALSSAATYPTALAGTLPTSSTMAISISSGTSASAAAGTSSYPEGSPRLSSAISSGSGGDAPSGFLTVSAVLTGSGRWTTVQQTLMESQWAHKYSGRAASVIAMFDPAYAADPEAAQQRIDAVLRPPRATRHRRARSAASVRLAAYSRHSASRKRTAQHSRRRRKTT